MTLYGSKNEKINAKEIIDFSNDDSVVLLLDSYNQHKKDAEILLSKKLKFPAFVSLMTALEIYLKIHITTYCFFHMKKMTTSEKKRIEIITGDNKLLNNFKYILKVRYKHDLIKMIEDLSILIHDKPKIFKE